MASQTITRLCPFCEACCGLVVEVDPVSRQVVSIKGDKDNPFSQGFLCPKSQGLRLLDEDPDRSRKPLVRRGSDFVETDLDSALDEAATASLSGIAVLNGIPVEVAPQQSDVAP